MPNNPTLSASSASSGIPARPDPIGIIGIIVDSHGIGIIVDSHDIGIIVDAHKGRPYGHGAFSPLYRAHCHPAVRRGLVPLLITPITSD